MSNYRPVSLLTSFSEIFETVMQRRILKHLTNCNILITEQYGLRLGLRTNNATYKLTTEILNAMNNKLLVGGIFCDLEKAFDCVNHDTRDLQKVSALIFFKLYLLRTSKANYVTLLFDAFFPASYQILMPSAKNVFG